MWAVAWRQHRGQIAAWFAMMAVLAAALLWFRHHVITAWLANACELHVDTVDVSCTDDRDADLWWNGMNEKHDLLVLAMYGLPIIVGALGATLIFSREFSHGTHRFALTQSVGRRHWFTAKTATVLGSILVGLLGLGYIAQWTDSAVSQTSRGALATTALFRWSIVPAAVGLLAFTVALAIGMFTRNMIATLVTAIIVAGSLTVGVGLLGPHLLPTERSVTTVAEVFPSVTQAEIDAEFARSWRADGGVDLVSDPNRLQLRHGYLGADGQPLDISWQDISACQDLGSYAAEQAAADAGIEPLDWNSIEPGSENPADYMDYYDTAVYRNASSRAEASCWTGLGIASTYSDHLPGTHVWALRGVVSGLLILLAAAATAVAVLRFPRAVAKR